jgi:hypothetical protein
VGFVAEEGVMSTTSKVDALSFVQSLDLEEVPTHSGRFLGAPPPRFVPKSDRDQALIVGSQIQTFGTGVDEKMRRAIEDAMLLAQLTAKKQVGEGSTRMWYDTYFDALSNMGLLVKDKGFSSYDTGSVTEDVERSILELVATLVGGPATTAYKIIAAALKAVLELDKDNPAITIFSRETRVQHEGRFQLSVVEKSDRDDIDISLMAFKLDARADNVQVLFFKHKTESANLRYAGGMLGVNRNSLERAADAMAEKAAAFCEGYVRALPLPDAL